MVKLTYSIIGTLVYSIFLATFICLIAFLADLAWLPKTIDRGAVGVFFPSLLRDAALIAIFGLQHSVMARQSFKRVWTKIIPKPLERSIYVLASSVALIILFLGWTPLHGDVWRVSSSLGTAGIWALFATGWLIVLLSTFLLNHFELFGLQQIYLHARGRTAAPASMKLPFFYKMVRHPLYTGFLIAFWATPHMTVGHFLFALGMSFYILGAIRLEERDLVSLFGRQYEDYRNRVGMLAPCIRRPTRP